MTVCLLQSIYLGITYVLDRERILFIWKTGPLITRLCMFTDSYLKCASIIRLDLFNNLKYCIVAPHIYFLKNAYRHT